MERARSRFELTLNLPEIVVCFCVMVVLFTGLLLFGYRVGASQRAQVTPVQQPVAPAQEGPQQSEEGAPAMEMEPEIHLENTPTLPDVPGLPGGDDEGQGRKPMAGWRSSEPSTPSSWGTGVLLAQQSKAGDTPPAELGHSDAVWEEPAPSGEAVEEGTSEPATIESETPAAPRRPVRENHRPAPLQRPKRSLAC